MHGVLALLLNQHYWQTPAWLRTGGLQPQVSCPDYQTSLQTEGFFPHFHLHVHKTLTAGLALLIHGTQLSPTEEVEAALAALDLAIDAFEHGPTRLHQTAYETAVMAINVAMHAMHSTGALSTPGPLRPSTPPPGN